jgi:hypothetical protein
MPRRHAMTPSSGSRGSEQGVTGAIQFGPGTGNNHSSIRRTPFLVPPRRKGTTRAQYHLQHARGGRWREARRCPAWRWCDIAATSGLQKALAIVTTPRSATVPQPQRRGRRRLSAQRAAIHEGRASVVFGADALMGCPYAGNAVACGSEGGRVLRRSRVSCAARRGWSWRRHRSH